MEEIVETGQEKNMIALIKRNDIESVKKVLDGGHTLTVDEFSNCRFTTMVELLYTRIHWTAEAINQLAVLAGAPNNIVNVVFLKLESSNQLSQELIEACLSNAISTSNLTYLNNFKEKKDNYFPPQKVLSRLYTEHLQECSKEENWLDAAFVSKLRICAVLYGNGARLKGLRPSTEVKNLNNFIALIAQYFTLYNEILHRKMPHPFLAFECLSLTFIHSHLNNFFKPKGELQWLAEKLEEINRIVQRLATKKHYFDMSKRYTDEHNLIKDVINDDTANTIRLNDIPLSNYFAGLLVLFLCQIDPSKHVFKKSFFMLKWEMFLECYYKEPSNAVRKSLIDRLKKTIDLENAETHPVKQQELMKLLTSISQVNKDHSRKADVDITSIIDKDSFNLIVEYLVAGGEIRSLAAVRQSCKTWRDAIDKARIWKTLLEEIGGPMWEIEYDRPAQKVIAEKFSPPSIFVMQCYNHILKYIPSRDGVDRLWGILTNNTDLAFKKSLNSNFYFEGPFNTLGFTIACAYGRNEYLKRLSKFPAPNWLDNRYPHPSYERLAPFNVVNAGWTQDAPGWPLKKMVCVSGAPIVDALSFCHPETVKMLTSHGANLQKEFGGYPAFLFALWRHVDHKSGQEMINMLDELMKNSQISPIIANTFIKLVMLHQSDASFKKLIDAIKSTRNSSDRMVLGCTMQYAWVSLNASAVEDMKSISSFRLTCMFDYHHPFSDLNFLIIQLFVSCLTDTHDNDAARPYLQKVIVKLTNALRAQGKWDKNYHDEEYGDRYRFYTELADSFEKRTLIEENGQCDPFDQNKEEASMENNDDNNNNDENYRHDVHPC